MTDIFKTWTGLLADWVELAAAVIIGLAAVEATLRAFALFVQRRLRPRLKRLSGCGLVAGSPSR